MPRPMLTDLAPFQEWLVQSYSISKKSASVYTSKVRKVLSQLDEITDFNLSSLANEPENVKSLDLFLTAWSRFQEFMLESSKIELPTMSRIKQNKNQRKTDICRPILEIANYLKTVTKMTYTKMISLKWNDVKTQTGETWEILDPTEYGTIYRVPSDLFRNLCDWMFGDEPINGSLPLFASAPCVRSRISRHQLSLALKDFIPLYENIPKQPMTNPNKVIPNQSLPTSLEIELETSLKGEDFISGYEMFDPDKI